MLDAPNSVSRHAYLGQRREAGRPKGPTEAELRHRKLALGGEVRSGRLSDALRTRLRVVTLVIRSLHRRYKLVEVAS